MFVEKTRLITSPNTFNDFDEFIEFNRHFRAFVDTAMLVESLMKNGSIVSTSRVFNAANCEMIKERTWLSEELFLSFKHSPERKALHVVWQSLGWQFEELPTS